MIRLSNLETYMKPNFIWNADPHKPLQTNELMEGSKEIARTVFTGIANMYGFPIRDICEYLDIGRDGYSDKIQTFRAVYKNGVAGRYMGREAARIYRKTRLVLNTIQTNTKTNPYVKMEVYIDNDDQP